MSKPKAVDKEKIKKFLATHSGWNFKGGKIRATYEFADFRAAFSFMTAIALEAQASNHHPEWKNVYNKVDIALSTHDAGDQVTEKDIRLAKYISEVAGLTKH